MLMGLECVSDQEIHEQKSKFTEHAGFRHVAVAAAFAVLAWVSRCLVLYKEATVETLE